MIKTDITPEEIEAFRYILDNGLGSAEATAFITGFERGKTKLKKDSDIVHDAMSDGESILAYYELELVNLRQIERGSCTVDTAEGMATATMFHDKTTNLTRIISLLKERSEILVKYP